MMTEEEARTKWCPEARVGVRWMKSQSPRLEDLNAVAINRSINADIRELTRCQASDCMYWRRMAFYQH